MNLDVVVFKFIHGLAGKSICLDSLGIFLAVYLIWLMPVLVCLIYFLKGRGKELFKILFFCSLSFILVYLFNFIIEKIYFRLRPFVVLNLPSLIDVLPKESSFPSTHTALAFVFAFSLYFINRRLGIIFLVLAILVGISRIFVGVHWPSDILAGIVLGLFCSLIVNKFLTHKPIIHN